MKKHFYMLMIVIDILIMSGIAVAVYYNQHVAGWGLLVVFLLWIHAILNIKKIEE